MTDEELMQAVCSGDQSAYQVIVRQHVKAISQYAFRLLGNTKDTEDITQEAFLKLWVNAASWQPKKSKLSTWLHRITHNLCIDYLRKHGKTVIHDFAANDTEESADQVSLQESVSKQNEAVRLEAEIAKLPENQRSALMLCHFAGFSNKEAAAIMGVSVKALESSISRARRSLKTSLIEGQNGKSISEENIAETHTETIKRPIEESNARTSEEKPKPSVKQV